MAFVSLTEQIKSVFKDRDEFTLEEVYEIFSDKPKTTVRGRINESVGKWFKRIARAKYTVISTDKDEKCVLIEGDGRDLSFLDDNSIDAIVTDHPWEDNKSNIGGDRKFTNSYNCFRYTLNDFKEKARVLKNGSFLVEVIPAENESNYEYLYNIKQMAKQCGLLYYAKVPWKKGSFVSNTGRKAKNTEDIMIFSKGKPRPLRKDVKKTNATGVDSYMSGTNGMLPTMFDIQAVSNNSKIHQSEKPSQLYQQILDYITLDEEIVLDQFAGSGALGEACILKNRKCIMIEILKENINKIKNRLQLNTLQCDYL